MDFSLTPDQHKAKQETIEFAQNELNSNVLERQKNSRFPMAEWRKCAEFGIQGLRVPKEYGGQDVDPVTSLLMMEGLGYGCEDNGLAYGLNSQMCAFQPAILRFGTEEQKQKILPAVCSGEKIGAFGITEAESGSDSYSIQTIAKEVDGGYLLNGRKTYISLAPVCDVAIIFATLGPELGKWGITAFLVEKGDKGFSLSDAQDKMGMHTAPLGELILEDCFVPTENILGDEGAGVSMFTTTMEVERGYIFASQVGRMERQLEIAVDYAKNRKTFGKPIGNYQSVSNRIADMKLRLELAKMMMYKVAWMQANEMPLIMEAAMAKLYLSEMFVESSFDLLRIHGVKGYMADSGIETDLRDGIGGLFYSGTSDIQRNIIARMMGLDTT